MSKRKNTSPAAQRRDALTETITARGRQNASIWYVFDPGRRQPIVLVGDYAHELFLATEGDPDIVLANYEKASVEIFIDGEKRLVTFDAVVTFRDGRRECRDVHTEPLGEDPVSIVLLARKRAAASYFGATYVEITTADLDRLKQRTRNWARAIAALARCRDIALGVVEGLLLIRLGSAERQTLGELIQALSGQAPAALIVGATVSLLRQRQLGSDLDTQTWCQNTCVWRATS